jgi:hypothetical protein
MHITTNTRLSGILKAWSSDLPIIFEGVRKNIEAGVLELTAGPKSIIIIFIIV